MKEISSIEYCFKNHLKNVEVVWRLAKKIENFWTNIR